MTDPTRFSDEERAREAVRDRADEAKRLDSAWTDQINADQYPAALPDEQGVSGERLFSRKSLFGWAFAALIFIFIIRMVLPVVFETVKENVVAKMKESTHNTSGSGTGTAGVAPTPPTAPTSVTPALPEVPAQPKAPVPPAPVKKTRR